MEFLKCKLTGSQKQAREKHETLPWISSPFNGVDLEHIAFHQRHEANPVELFFDLYFVANLCTLTAYHSITDSSSLLSYIGFFTILWSTWFQITLFDCRFARDSAYERTCKAIQFVIFIVFAYIGAKFDPKKNEGDPVFFRTICITLAVSRFQLAVQYGMVLIEAVRLKARPVFLPLGVVTGAFLIATIVLGGLTAAFNADTAHPPNLENVFYGVIVFEALSVIGASIYWRTISFKKTHIMERMGLLTLIVIGEGAIGVTKTVGKMMGKNGLQTESSGLVFCIIMILVFLWVLYFDNQPSHHYGTIRQQIFCLLHFPFHLAIVGVVEGSQQIALARYVISGSNDMYYKLAHHCLEDHLDRKALAEAIEGDLGKYYLSGYKEFKNVEKVLKYIAGTKDICSPDHLANDVVDQKFSISGLPYRISILLYEFTGTLFESLGMKLPKGEDLTVLASNSYEEVYKYFWVALIIVLTCLALFLVLTRRNKHDVFDLTSVATRVFFALFATILVLVGRFNENFRLLYQSSVMILPTITIFLAIIIGSDRVGREMANWRLRRKGYDYESAAKERPTNGFEDDDSAAKNQGVVYTEDRL